MSCLLWSTTKTPNLALMGEGSSDYSRYVSLADLSLQDQAPIREGINLAQTLYNSLAQIFRDGYDLIISTHSERP